MRSEQVRSVRVKIQGDQLPHSEESRAPLTQPLSPLLELVIDVTPQIYATNDIIDNCVEFLESRNLGNKCVQAFRLLLSEALANAIEHGVLCLPSTLKEDPFNPYNEILRRRLNEIKPGQVILKIRLLHENNNCDIIKSISVEITDSGPGFDWRSHIHSATMPGPDKPFGRGLALIKMVADQVNFNESGNSIQFIIPCDTDT
jgi:anti-sigma regulatory factor (Ser/Thr protein kinase)